MPGSARSTVRSFTSATQVPVLADSQDPRIGQLLCNRYQVRRVVADGGMGRVYEALDMQAAPQRSAQGLHPDVSRDEIAVQRFKREFEVSKMLPHDHIVEVLDFSHAMAASSRSDLHC